MLPVSLDFRFVFLHLVNPLYCLRRRKTKRKPRETGNIGGTQDEEKQNDNPENLAT
jgi:hypothetical protein